MKVEQVARRLDDEGFKVKGISVLDSDSDGEVEIDGGWAIEVYSGDRFRLYHTVGHGLPHFSRFAPLDKLIEQLRTGK